MTAPDEEFLADWSREQQLAAYRRDRDWADRCDRCGHAWHGIQCRAQGAAFPCGCPSSFEASA